MLDSEQKLYISAATGALFFMLRENSVPVWKRFVFFIIGTVSASVTTEALVQYFSLGPAVSGGVGFFCAVLVLPIAETLIDLARNPMRLVRIIRGVRGAPSEKENE